MIEAMLSALVPNAGAANMMSAGLQGGAGIGTALGGLFSASYARDVMRANEAVVNLQADLDARQERRLLRYQMGAARAGNAGAGNSKAGSLAYVMADNAYHAERKVQDHFLRAKQRNAQGRLNTPTPQAAMFDAAGALFQTGAQVFGTLAGGASLPTG